MQNYQLTLQIQFCNPITFRLISFFMMRFVIRNVLYWCLFLAGSEVTAQQIVFCGEVIPVENDFVGNKLMNVIRQQIPNVNLSSLKERANEYFPYIEAMLKEHGIPEDFKYVPIVECGFRNLSSVAGARGFWQLMPATAQEYNLVVNSQIDERDDPVKATKVACKLILNNYRYLKTQSGTESWVLTAASYNWGVGNIAKTVRKQGDDYFSMDLNAETAEYVYKIIAVKELFENPEFYMQNLGGNVFRKKTTDNSSTSAVPAKSGQTVHSDFSNLKITVGSKAPKIRKTKTTYVLAHLIPGNRKFSDGNLVSLQLETNLEISGNFVRKGNIIKGRGWIINEKVYVDLGYGPDVQVLDNTMTKGIPLSKIDDDELMLMLKTTVPDL